MSWDLAAFHAINGLAGRSRGLDALMVFLASPESLVVPAVVAFAVWYGRDRRTALGGTASLVALVGLSDFVGGRLKHLVARPRPCHVLEGVHEVIACGGAFSMPSNHALNTAAAAAFFQVLYPWTGWIGWPLVLAIGVGRVYLGAHWVSDVLVGWAIGGAGGVAAGLAVRRWRRVRADSGERR